MSLTIQVNKELVLQSYLPKKVWYALYKNKLIVKSGNNWKINEEKQSEITIPIEIVETSNKPKTIISKAKRTKKQTKKVSKKTYKTIRKNASQMIAKIEKGFISGRSYYHGNWTDINSLSNIQKELNTYNGAYLSYWYDEQKYTLHIHSNSFINFKSTYEP